MMANLIKHCTQWTMMAIASVWVTTADAIARPLHEIQDIARATTVLIDGLNPGSGVIVAQDREHYWVLTAQHVMA
ncbi:MAG: hypothetical protein F6K31_43565, partial [Symploca sp. SIO2G7]|nr:hypothetical protein [Symploca sp. SIO2G7]